MSTLEHTLIALLAGWEGQSDECEEKNFWKLFKKPLNLPGVELKARKILAMTGVISGLTIVGLYAVFMLINAFLAFSRGNWGIPVILVLVNAFTIALQTLGAVNMVSAKKAENASTAFHSWRTNFVA